MTHRTINCVHKKTLIGLIYNVIRKIARRTTGAKSCYFLAGFLQVSHIFLKHLLQFCRKSLTSLLQVSMKLLTNILGSLYLVLDLDKSWEQVALFRSNSKHILLVSIIHRMELTLLTNSCSQPGSTLAVKLLSSCHLLSSDAIKCQVMPSDDISCYTTDTLTLPMATPETLTYLHFNI